MALGAHRLGTGDPLARSIEQETPVAARDGIDAELVNRFRAGERAAFDGLVQRHQRSIYYLVLRYVGNEADAADVTQKAFVRAFTSISGFRGESSFRTWLYRVAINLALNHLRDHRRRAATALADVGEHELMVAPQGLAGIADGQDAATLRRAVAELPPKQRMVLELRIYDELSFREVAELSGCTENAAKVNFHHAIKRLRAILAEQRARETSREQP